MNNPPATAFLKRLTYGELQSKLVECGSICKGLEDVVGSVKGYLRVQ